MTPSAPAAPSAIPSLLLLLALCFGVAALGGLATASTVDTWYQALDKPAFTPPDWLFAPVWSVLYAMMALAAWRIWNRRDRPGARLALVLFGLQLALNLGWSVLFFGLVWPGGAFVDIVLLLAVLALTIVAFFRIDRVAGVLLAPYWAWTAFAAVLNGVIWLMN
jgi:tryptophan-rich sensory protein